MNNHDLITLLFLIFILLAGGVLGALLHSCYGSGNGSSSSRPAASQPGPSSGAVASPAPGSGDSQGIVRDVYRTRDGLADYTFSFERQGIRSWRAYIVTQPGYSGRDDDAHATHRLTASNRKYVCWTDTLTSLEMAKQVAALWADATQEYIRTGTRF